MNIGIYLINSKDKNAECRVGNTKIQLHRLKKNITIYRFYNNIQRPIKRERETKRERQREVKGEYNDSGGEREQESERDTKSRVVERTRELEESNM